LGEKTQGRQCGGQVTEQSDSRGVGHGMEKLRGPTSCRIEWARPRPTKQR
jgi:hypothetical protein